jgi:MscS family membrane protein
LKSTVKNDTILVKKNDGEGSEKFYISSPQMAVKTFIANMSRSNYHPEIAVRVMDCRYTGNADKIDLAKKLKKIIDGKGLYLNIKALPESPDFKDSSTKKNQYVLFDQIPEIYLEKIGAKWQFSSETVSKIDKLYDAMIPFDMDSIIDKFPPFVHISFLGVEMWQYLGFALYLCLAFVILKALRIILKFVFNRILKTIEKEDYSESFVVPVASSFSLLLVILLLQAFIPTLELPAKLNMVIIYALKLTIPFAAIVIGFRLIDVFSLFLEKLASKTKSTLDDHLVPFARKALKGFVLALGAFYVLDVLHVNITPLLAGVSIGGLAFALAAQDTVKNIFGSLTIFVDQPFSIGDWIIFKEGEGVVEEIGLRSTRIRTFTNSLITIPNGKLGDMVIDNMGKRDYNRYSAMLGIAYNTPIAVIESFVTGIRKIVESHPNTHKDMIQSAFYEYAESSLHIKINMFFDVENYQEELKARQTINLQIYKLAEDLGVSFAFPTRSLYIENDSMKSTLTKEEFESKLENFSKRNLAQNNDSASKE